MSQALPPAAPVRPPQPDGDLQHPPERPPALSDDTIATIAAAAAAGAVAAQKEAERASRHGGRLKRMVLGVGAACAVLLGTVSVSIPAPHVPWDTSYSDPCLSYVTDAGNLLDQGLDRAVLALHAPAGCPTPRQLVTDWEHDHPNGVTRSSP
jgi:hypothetical protein